MLDLFILLGVGVVGIVLLITLPEAVRDIAMGIREARREARPLSLSPVPEDLPAPTGPSVHDLPAPRGRRASR